MITTGFHHITIVTSNIGHAVRFYRDMLGMNVVAHAENPAAGAPAMHFGNAVGEPGTLLSVLERPAARHGRPGAGGVHHFALTVETPEAQLKWKRRLEDGGVPVSGPYDRGWFRSIYFTDPDGQIVEIATRGPGYTVDEPADALGSGVMIPPGAELRGERDEAVVRARTYPEPVPVITPDMKLDGLHHISGMTDDVERIGEFYEAALGLRRVKRSVNQDDPSMPHWFWATYDGRDVAPRSSLTMFGGWENGGSALAGRLRRATEGAGQTHSIAFRAHDEEQLHTWRDHIRSIGTDVSDIVDRKWYRSIQFRAPDGLLMEISTDVPGFEVGRTLQTNELLDTEVHVPGTAVEEV
jgi:glyoxalase family protein